MTIRIRKTPYHNNSGDFPLHADEARAQLGVIAAGGLGELPGSYGDHPDPADNNYSLVDYDPGPQDLSTPSGRVKDRLRTLVSQATSYEIIGIGPDFVWGDGKTVEAQPAITLGTTVFYDTSNCGGKGRWVIGTNNHHECTQAAIMLYHELGGHAWLQQPPTESNAQAEAEAIHEENDLRVAMGLVARDETRLEGGCTCPGSDCCIIATVATGSPVSAEIGALRRLRDDTLRQSAIGDALFSRLYYEYYGFSHLVCRIMLRNERARVQVERYFVRPLVDILDLANRYVAEPGDLEDLGRRWHSAIARDTSWVERGLIKASMEEVLEALGHGGAPAGTPSLDSGTRAICDLLAEWVPRSPTVQWAIVEPLRIHAQAVVRFADIEARPGPAEGRPFRVTGQFLANAFENWLTTMPLDGITEQLSRAEIIADLPRFEAILGGSSARHRLPERLTALGATPTPSGQTRSGEVSKQMSAVTVRRCECIQGAERVRLHVTLENSGDHPAYAISELRRLHLDPATGVLTLWLSERDQPQSKRSQHRHQTQPKTVAIDAGAQHTLSVELPPRVTRIVTGEDGSFDFEPLDLSAVRSVVARLSIHHTPFYFRPGAGTMQQQVARWGSDLELVGEIKPGETRA